MNRESAALPRAAGIPDTLVISIVTESCIDIVLKTKMKSVSMRFLGTLIVLITRVPGAPGARVRAADDIFPISATKTSVMNSVCFLTQSERTSWRGCQ